MASFLDVLAVGPSYRKQIWSENKVTPKVMYRSGGGIRTTRLHAPSTYGASSLG